MRTLRQAGEHEIEIKKSRFICWLAPVTSVQEAREVIARCKRVHHEARHNCSAFVLGDRGEVQKSSDDGEPAGTAGVPMLEVLRRNEVTNAVAVVTRYFGGVLLGAGGLIRAYGGAVSEALEVVGTVQRRPVRVVFVSADYATAGKLDNELRSAGHHVAEVEYADRAARFHVHVPENAVDELLSWLSEVTAGAAEVELGEVRFSEA